MKSTLLLLLFATFAVAQQISQVHDANEAMRLGVAAYKQARYPDAMKLFQRAVDLDPQSFNPRLYLAITCMNLYVPGADSPQNVELAQRAEKEFQKVLAVDDHNETALRALATLKFQQAASIPEIRKKTAALDEAAQWYRKLLDANPEDKEAEYTLGVMDWLKSSPDFMSARVRIGLKPEDPGPLPAGARQALGSQYRGIIEDGISHLETALALDPGYDDAMAYMNLLIRERADLAGSKQQYESEVQLADQWVQKALDTKKHKAH